MKNYSKTVLILILICMLVLCGCGSKATEGIVSKNIITSDIVNNSFEGFGNYELVLETEKAQLYFDKTTTAIRLVNRSDGFVWESAANKTKANSIENAPFTLTYITAEGKVNTMDAMSMSIARNQYKYSKTKEGFEVTYSLGDYSDLMRYPYAMDKERMEFLLENIEDEFDREKLDNMYNFIELEKLSDEQKKVYLDRCPALKEVDLYILRDRVANYPDQIKALTELVGEAGYTEKMYEEDLKYGTNDSTEKKSTPHFRIKLIYSLKDNELTVTVPQKEIEMGADCPLVSLELLKYLGSPDTTDNGYFLLPDGSGSVMNFYNGRSNLQNYTISVYGPDHSVASKENVYNYEQAYLPVYGINKDGHGLLATVTEGDAVADISAFTGSDRLLPFANVNFRVREYYKSQRNSSRSSDYFVIVQNKRYSGDMAVKYSLVENADLKAFANVVRKDLFGDKKALTAASPELLMECIGSFTKSAQMLGIGYQKEIVMTKLSNLPQMTDGFKESGVNGISVRLDGFISGGLKGSVANSFKLQKSLGGEKAFNTTLEKLKKSGITVYPSADFQYTYKDSAFDGFSKSGDTVRLISRQKGLLVDYNPATFCRDEILNSPIYINNAKTISSNIKGFFGDYRKYENSAVALTYFGKFLYADYDEANTFDRGMMKKLITDEAKAISKDYSVITTGANAYMLPFVKAVTDAPLKSNGYDITDYSVPFLQMVMSGYVKYSGSPLNSEGDATEQLLRSASVAADVSCVVAYQNSNEIEGSQNTELYNTDYSYVKAEHSAAIADYQKAFKGLSGEEITSFKVLTDNVTVTGFKNGKTVTVNYGATDYTDESGSLIKARSYLVG